MQIVDNGGLNFIKAVACGNDFVIADVPPGGSDLGAITRRLCDRHQGVGADGVEWLSKPATGDSEVNARLVNADGSEAEISGNGTRCVAAYWLQTHGGDQVRVQTGAGVKICRKTGAGKEADVFSMNMGTPNIHGECNVRTGKADIHGTSLSLGNPHFVIFVENFEFDWRSTGLQVQRSGVFPHGVNVEFVKIRSNLLIDARFFERGVGETMSSGTGSCAAAVAAIHTERCRNEVEVHSLGGSQKVQWEPGQEVLLEGPAKVICSGKFFI